MSNRLEVLIRPAVREDGVPGITLVRAPDGGGARNGSGVVWSRPAFCDEEVVVAVFLVDVRTFRVRATGAISDPRGGTGGGAGG